LQEFLSVEKSLGASWKKRDRNDGTGTSVGFPQKRREIDNLGNGTGGLSKRRRHRKKGEL